jgi:hypothetical protein
VNISGLTSADAISTKFFSPDMAQPPDDQIKKKPKPGTEPDSDL